MRREYYECDCVDEPILWGYYYETSHPKLIGESICFRFHFFGPNAGASECLIHLTLCAMGAKRIPYPCHGCEVRHREHFSEAKSGKLDMVAAIIEYWIYRIGEQPTRIPIYE